MLICCLVAFMQVPFGKIVRCHSCMIAVAVAHPQNGIQACTNKPINKFIYLSSGMLLGIKTITVNGENTS